MSQSLFQIREEHQAIIAQLEESEGLLTPELETALRLTQEAFTEKAMSYAYVVRKFEADTEIIDAEIKRLQSLKKAADTRIDLFKKALGAAMQEFKIEKVETPTLKIFFRPSKAIVITDEKLIPMAAKKMIPATFEISKTKIKELIDSGVVVPGAYQEERKSLQIK